MRRIFKKINILLDRKQKLQMVGIVFLMLIGGILEALGIAILAPIMQIVVDPQKVEESKYLSALYHGLNLSSTTQLAEVIMASLILVFRVEFYSKGGDVILRTAKILKEDIAADFEWKVYGVKDMKVWEKLCGIKAKDVNICICGIINAVGLVDAVTDADVFVHPSYIENSPNTVCEAQVLGIPVIANHVGGVSSLIKHMENGILLPANDPYMSASYVSDIFSDKNLATRIGTEGRKVAINRHNPNTIVNDVMNVY